MNDVVSRLRDYASVAPHSAMGLCTEAADEIERLRKLVTDACLLCPTCGSPAGAEVTGAELRSLYKERRRAALDRMIEIAEESGMYNLDDNNE